MMWNKLKVVAAVGLMAGLTVGGAGVAAQQGGEGQANAPVAEKPKDNQIKKELKILEQLESLVVIQQLEQERSRLKTDLNSIRRKTEQMKFEHVTALGELEKQAEEIQKHLASAEQKWKELVRKGESAPREGEPSKDLESANKEIKRLRAELQAARPETQGANQAASPKPSAPGEGKVSARRSSASPMVMQLDGDLVMVIPGEQDRVTVLNTKTGTRATQRFTEGVTEVIPIVSPGLVSLVFKGPEVRQVVAYDHQGGKWYPQDLVEPTTEAKPTPGGREVIYQVGRFVYVFSFQAKKWGVLELKRDPGRQSFLPGMNAMQDGKMMIPEGDLIHIYDAKTGEWTHIDTKDDGTK